MITARLKVTLQNAPWLVLACGEMAGLELLWPAWRSSRLWRFQFVSSVRSLGLWPAPTLPGLGIRPELGPPPCCLSQAPQILGYEGLWTSRPWVASFDSAQVWTTPWLVQTLKQNTELAVTCFGLSMCWLLIHFQSDVSLTLATHRVNCLV